MDLWLTAAGFRDKGFRGMSFWFFLSFSSWLGPLVAYSRVICRSIAFPFIHNASTVLGCCPVPWKPSLVSLSGQRERQTHTTVKCEGYVSSAFSNLSGCHAIFMLWFTAYQQERPLFQQVKPINASAEGSHSFWIFALLPDSSGPVEIVGSNSFPNPFRRR